MTKFQTKSMTPALSLLAGLLLAAPAFAQTSPPASDYDRNVNQQERIESGLKSGQLTTKEAGHLEKEEAKVDHMEQKADADGHVSAAEQQRIDRAQNKVSQDIHADKTNGRTGNPDSKSSERMQADVQRDVNQQQRIDNGVKSGALTTREAGKLERGQAHDDRLEAKAAANGHVNAREQARIERSENHQSDRIHDKKHNGRRAS